jgi:hypothetical protein
MKKLLLIISVFLSLTSINGYTQNVLMGQSNFIGFTRASDGAAIPMISVVPQSNGLSNLQIGSGSGQFYLSYTDIFAGGSSKLRILSNGNVGIGTTTPTYKLHVAGDIFTNGAIIAGNVSIGSTSTSVNGISYKLAVKGSIVATSLDIVPVSNFPDYVFEHDYKLKSLAELDQFISLNKHLPEIPSAKEMKDKGVYSVAEMDNLLLKKIEELTIYMIALNKENEALKSEIKTLKQ